LPRCEWETEAARRASGLEEKRAGPAELVAGSEAARLEPQYNGMSAPVYPDRVTTAVPSLTHTNRQNRALANAGLQTSKAVAIAKELTEHCDDSDPGDTDREISTRINQRSCDLGALPSWCRRLPLQRLHHSDKRHRRVT
jgi:hypothetical protein